MTTSLHEKVLRSIAYNTGGPQPDTIDLAHVRVIACGTGEAAPEEVKQTVAELLEDGELVEAEDGFTVAE